MSKLPPMKPLGRRPTAQKPPQAHTTNSQSGTSPAMGTNSHVAKGPPSGSVPSHGPKNPQSVTIIMEIGPAQARGEHRLPYTGSDLMSYARQIPAGQSIIPRGRVFTHQPEFGGPRRLWHVPRAGETLIVHDPKWSAARHLGQRIVGDDEVAAKMMRMAQAATVEQSQPRRQAVRVDDRMEAALGKFFKP